MFRFVAFLSDDRDEACTQLAQGLASRLCANDRGWRCVFRAGPLSVHTTAAPTSAWIRPGERGIVLGTLFHTQRHHEFGCADPPVRTDPLTLESLLRNDADRLIGHGWGNYVAFYYEPDAHRAWVLKDPTGSLPCLHTQHRRVHVFFSHLADLIRLKLRPITLHGSYLQRRVCGVCDDADDNALEGVRQLAGGERLEIDFNRTPAAQTPRHAWRPEQFCCAERRITDLERARSELRATLACCTQSLAIGQDHLVHRLSGGLDSSIVLACLTQPHIHSSLTSYTYFDPGARADERAWARLIAMRRGCTHLERAFAPEEAPLHTLASLAPTPKPIAALAYLQRAPFERELCAELGARAVFCGMGGDSGLCRDSVALSAADFVHDHGVRPTLIRLSAAVARHTQRAIWEVIREALPNNRARAARSEHDAIAAHLTRLVSPELKAAVTSAGRRAPPHPWFASAEAPPSLPRRLSVQGLDFYDWSISPENEAPQVIAPLQAQPVVELCLQIPSYIHFQDGRERGLARTAFAHELPPEITARRWKDRAPGFLDAVLAHHRAFVREFLLEGVLVRERLLARKAVEDALAERAVIGVYPVEILNHLNTECWARHWAQGV